MILAHLELFHSRPIAPTRRLALGTSTLPLDPAPGLGSLLLGAVVAANVSRLDPEYFDPMDQLALQVGRGQRVSQPRLRHRLQVDRVGLQRSEHRLKGQGDELYFDLDDRGTPAQNILAALYAAGQLAASRRGEVVEVIRRAMRWSGDVDHALTSHLAGSRVGVPWTLTSQGEAVGWALKVLGFPHEGGSRPETPGARTVQRRFRELVTQAHPDHGGEPVGAALRISELDEARRILLAA